MRTLTIEKNDAGQRVDKYLSKALPNLPMSLMYKFIRTKKIKVNRKRTDPKVMLELGDTVELFIAEEFFEKKKRSLPSVEKLPPDVVYEDENILLVNKPSGLLCHSDEADSEETLIDRVLSYLVLKGEYNPDEEESFAPALCNRIDRNTAGIVIAAKNAEALRVMNEKIKAHQIEKSYLCIVHGKMESRSGCFKNYLFKDQKNNRVTVYDRYTKGAKEAETHYRVIDFKNNLSLLEVRLITGRTHQIRAQFAHAGHPLLGDGKYGVNREDRKKGYSSQALCSYKLRFAFEGEATALDYLSGKEVALDRSKIDFLKEFERG